jgi:hypothetical protein
MLRVLLRTLNRSQEERQEEEAMPVSKRQNGAPFFCIGMFAPYQHK